MERLALLTCTKDRPKELRNLLTSIREQIGEKPYVHIIIDGSDNPVPVKEVVDQFTDLPIQYHHLRPPGLTRQKNFGISLLTNDIEWVGVLDDDVVLDKSCLQNLRDHVSRDSEVQGIGLAFSNIKLRTPNFFRNLLLLDGKNDGGFTPSGIPNSLHRYDKDLSVEWPHGGATFWRMRILKEFPFDEWFSGVGHFEDIDFSYRVSRKNKLIFLPTAQAYVYENPIHPNRLIKVGTWQVVAWWYFATNKASFNKILVSYSIINVLLVNLITGLIKPSSNRILNALGNLKGLGIILSGKTLHHRGYQK